MTSIPVIGTAIVNSAHWISRLINSVDYPVDNFVVFNNNGRGQITKELDEIISRPHPFIKHQHVTHMPTNIGCPGAWNLIIKSYVNAPYWIIVNHDVAFTPGFLAEMARLAEDAEVGMIHGSGGDFNDGGYDLFLIKDWVVQDYGLFDENLYPAYGEDVDYIMRLKHRPIKKIPSVGLPYYHGEGFTYDDGQQTKKGDPELEQKLNEVNLINFEYLYEKWGPQWRMTWPYYHPFNKSDIPITYTGYNIDYVRRKYLGF